MVCGPKWPFYSWIVILDCWDRLYTSYVSRVELPIQRRLCPIFVRNVGSPDIHECFRGLTDSQRTPGIWGIMSHPDSRSDQIGGSEPVSRCENIYWDYLTDFFFMQTCTCGYGPHFITESTYHIHIQKNYHRSGVQQNLFTYTESHLHIQKLYFYIYKSEHGTYCDEPLLVCWPSSMRKFSDVLSCTYTD